MNRLPSSHLIPRSVFHHIGILVMVMAVMASFCALGFISVYDITRSWVGDIHDKISVEIPAFNSGNKTVYEQADIDSNVVIIEKLLNNDPIITKLDIQKIDIEQDKIDDDRFDIPSPAFITLSLHPERANNAELRIIDSIKAAVPSAVIIPQDILQETIEQTAWILSFVFGGLAMSVFIVTAIILSATIRMQLKAQKDVITLIHLMGAHANDISKLFKNAITVPVVWGGIIGLGLCFITSITLLPLLNLHDKGIDFIYSLAMIFGFFVLLCRLITQITVVGALKELP